MLRNYKIRFWDICITSIISLFLTVKIYGILYGQIGWSGLSDFYSGVSIFENHNKYLDIYIYFVYLILFFIFYPLVYLLRDKVNIVMLNLFQHLIGYKPANPPDMAYMQRYKKFSITAFILIIILFCFTSYSAGMAPVDDHHFGEKFAAFLMHGKFNLEYYKDIMLVHGRMDIFPSLLGSFFFGGNNIEGYMLGEVLYRDILFILTSICIFFIFDKNILYTAPFMLLSVLRTPSLSVMMTAVFILMLKENLLNKPVLWFWLYIAAALLFASFWTTIGGFWVIASMPAFVYVCYKMPDRKKHLYLASGVLLVLSIIFRDTFFEFLEQSKYYVQGTLYAFGNDFGVPNKMPAQTAFEWLYKMAALFFTPVIILEFIKQAGSFLPPSPTLKGGGRGVLFLLFSLIFVLISLKYTLGRLDNGLFQRLEYISFPFLCVIIPYWFYKFTDKGGIKFEKVLILLFAGALICLCAKIPETIRHIKEPQYISSTKLFNTGNVKFNSVHEKRLTEIQEYLLSKDKNESFLDLTNRGMHYLYFDKPVPVKYTSFYNSIASKQAVKSAEKLRKNMPDNILIYSNNIAHDNIRPSLRINALYRQIFLKKIYEYKKIGESIMLVKTAEYKPFTAEQIEDLDFYLGAQNLKYLPEVWAASMKTLPIVKTYTDFSVQNYGKEIKVRFSSPKKVKDLDLLYLNINQKTAADFKISINGSNSRILCRSKSGQILAPMDNFPSWLLNEDLREITIETSINVQTPEIEFFNKAE